MPVHIAQLQLEHHESGFGLGTAKPRISLRYGSTDIKDWGQARLELEITTAGSTELKTISTEQSVLIDWPFKPLSSRQVAVLRARSCGNDGEWTDWAEAHVEVGLLERECWKASMISGPAQARDQPKKPFKLCSTFYADAVADARLYATAYGLYEIFINGKRVGDQYLSPGWTSYHHRLNYQMYDVAAYIMPGENTVVAHVAEGWYAGRLGKANRNVWGETLGVMAQIEMGGRVVCFTDERWEGQSSELLESEIYNGEVIDTRPIDPVTFPPQILPFPSTKLILPQAPPVRQVMAIKPVEIITTPSGKRVLDFGQNMVGFVRLEIDFEGTGEIEIRHAEVMEKEELGVRPLRTALARWRVKLGGRTRGLQPSFTFFGFRYVEINYDGPFTVDDFTGIVISSDMRRTGHFHSSHDMINRLHDNVVWGMKGNFISLPTDCPQRDERLGWTGDIQVFGPTASYLYDTAAFLSEWLEDVAEEQKVYDGVPPIFVPWTPPPKDAVNPLGGHKPKPHGVWADVIAITPWDLFTAYGDRAMLDGMFDSMVLWLDEGLPRRPDGLWSAEKPQYGDWLDPKAPSQFPAHGRTDFLLPANAFLVSTTGLVAKIAGLLGRPEEERYMKDFARLRQMFRDEYITKNGRLASDTQTALTLALHFDLVDEDQRQNTVDRLEWLIRWEYFKISTGFAGTPLVLPNLARHGLLHLAYRMLQERDDPSWLYSVGMGATTIWERWDSMLPDGSINPGQMTSFNHYALGAVASFLHHTVGGLSPLKPGWKMALIKPQPGGTVTSASTSCDTSYGPYSVDWEIVGEKLHVKVSVPPNGSAKVELPGVSETVGSGSHQYTVQWHADPRWPPAGFAGPQSVLMPDRFVP